MCSHLLMVFVNYMFASEVKQKLQDCCNGVFSEHGLEEHIETIQKSRIITSSDMLKKLKGHICSEKLDGRLCGNLLTFSEEYKGSVLFLRWSCKNNHCGLWKYRLCFASFVLH